MKVSDNSLKFIMQEEGFKTKAYKDVVGLFTIGVGHLIRKDEEYLKTKTLTEQEVLDLLKQDILTAENAINTLVKKTLNQNQFDALASLIFNIGDGAWRKSSLLVKLNINPNSKDIIIVQNLTQASDQWLRQQLTNCKKPLLNTIEYSFLVWHKAGNPLKPILNLFNRRNREYKLYTTK